MLLSTVTSLFGLFVRTSGTMQGTILPMLRLILQCRYFALRQAVLKGVKLKGVNIPACMRICRITIPAWPPQRTVLQQEGGRARPELIIGLSRRIPFRLNVAA